jgi:hypothetical protein
VEWALANAVRDQGRLLPPISSALSLPKSRPVRNRKRPHLNPPIYWIHEARCIKGPLCNGQFSPPSGSNDLIDDVTIRNMASNEKAGWASAVISGLALIVSIVSFINSYRTNTLVAKANRPQLQISSVQLFSREIDPRRRRRVGEKLVLDLHNTGPAKAEKVELVYAWHADPYGNHSAPVGTHMLGAMFGVGAFAQQSFRPITIPLPDYLPDRPSPKESPNATLLLHGLLMYQTELGEKFKEPWCFVTSFADSAKYPAIMYSCDTTISNMTEEQRKNYINALFADPETGQPRPEDVPGGAIGFTPPPAKKKPPEPIGPNR